MPASRRGLADLLALLASYGADAWVDSGVLLGLRRDGELVPWEKDIDLGVTEQDLPSLLARRQGFERLGYEMVVHRYRGQVYAIGLNPTSRRPDGDLRAAIHVYYRHGDFLWSPQTQIYVPPPSPDVYRGTRSWAGERLRRFIVRRLYQERLGGDRTSIAPDQISPVYRAVRAAYRRLDRGLMAETWPIREVYVPLTWVMPAGLVLPLTSLQVGGASVPVPGNVDAYLTYRYGDWHIPVEDWCYWEDDGAIVHSPPADVLTRLRQNGFQGPA